MATITKEQLNVFVFCGKQFLIDRERTNPLVLPVESLLEPAIKRLKKVDRERDLVRLKLCKKNSTKHIELDRNGRYQYTEADNVTLLKEMDRIDAETVEMPSEIVTEFPEDGLSYDTRHSFEGIVIPKSLRKFDGEPEIEASENDD